jgi:hypothetical protein
MSKKVLSQMDVLSFMTISILSSTVFLGIVCTLLDEPFSDFQTQVGSFYLFRRSYVNWPLSISYATQHMRTTRVSLSLLGQAVLTSVLAWFFR